MHLLLFPLASLLELIDKGLLSVSAFCCGLAVEFEFSGMLV